MKSKTKSKVLSVLVCCMLIIGLLPTTVFAAGGTTVKINGQELKSGEQIQCGEGTASYDAQTNTLTLENATIEESSNVPVIHITGDLIIELKGDNTIISDEKRVVYAGITTGGTADIVFQGTGSDKLTIETNSDAIQADGGNITIDSCIVDVTSTSFGGVKANAGSNGNQVVGGKISINNADVTVDSAELAIVGRKGIAVSNSTIKATVNAQSNALYAENGVLDINNSTVEAYSVSDSSYPAIWANTLSVSSQSNVIADSNGSNGIYILNQCTISDSIVSAEGYYEAIFGENNININNSTIEASYTGTDGGWAIFSQDYHVSVTGNSDIIANGGMNADQIIVSPAEGKLMEIKAGDIADGEAGAAHFTDSPYAEEVTFIGADDLWTYTYVHIKPHTHTGGTATCTEPAICEDCGRPYGNALGHNAVKTEAKVATCTEEGNIEYWYCEACGKYFSDEALTKEITKDETVVKAIGHGETELKNAKEATCTEEGYTGDTVCKVCGDVLQKGVIIQKLTHIYQDGRCTVCGAADPNWQLAEQSGAEEDSPQTDDNSNLVLWIALAFLSASTALLLTIQWKRQRR